MKFYPFAIAGSIIFLTACMLNHTSKLDIKEGQPGPKADTVKIISFKAQVMPIFIKNCSPCHFPGGKMYERLPFDQDTTILNHSTAISKRIKDQQENELLMKFINANQH